jgi:Ca2+-binding EF-hand superfamily protein
MQAIEIEYGVEYYPNPKEGEQFEHLTESEFLSLIRDHERRGYTPEITYERFTTFDNGRDGRRLTIRDVSGIFYG